MVDKEEFEAPQVEVVAFTAADVIVDSCTAFVECSTYDEGDV